MAMTISAGAQIQECDFDPDKPSYQDALRLFEDRQYACAERQAALLLNRLTDSPHSQARVFMLLAGIKYRTTTDPTVKQATVSEKLLTALRIYPLYDDEPIVPALDFLIWLKKAREQVEEEIASSERMRAYRQELLADRQRAEDLKTTPWYRKWWVYGIGGGLVASAVIIAVSGGDESAARDTLPGFPGTP